jgi:CRISPR-associated protein Cmx8
MDDSVVGGASTKKKALNRSKQRVSIDPETELRLRWSLHELPSSQHRAGLVGLALCAQFLQSKRDRKGICKFSIESDELTLQVDRAGMQSLFDDIYDAKYEEAYSKAKWKGADPKRVDEIEVVEEKTGKTRREKRFVYDRVVPVGGLVRDWESVEAGTPGLWSKLWQDLVWSTLRGVPAQREPFNARADGRLIEDGGEAWDELATKPDASVEVASTHALGAQAKNAENVPFEDVARFRFLLNFWPFAVAIYVPANLQRDGTRDFVGYAVAFPDVAALEDFVFVWDQVMRARSSDASGYRPRDAVIDIAAEAGLDVLRRCVDVISAKQGAALTRPLLAAVDVFHVEKDGNNVRVRGVARVVPHRPQIDDYARVRSVGYWSPVFRRQVISNVLDEKPWWSGFAKLCSTTTDDVTIRHTAFRHDCRLALTEVEMKEAVSEAEWTLEHLIYRRVKAYVYGKLERKYELTWERVKGDSERETEFRDKREGVAREAFLAVRSRTGADFTAYFTSTICSIPQPINEEKFLELARALLDKEKCEHVRSLTLLALSAIA